MKFTVALVSTVFVPHLVQGLIPEGWNSEVESGMKRDLEKIKNYLEQEQNKFHDDIEKGIDVVQSAINTAIKEIDEALNTAINKIRELEEEAQAEGVETVECTKEQEQKLYDLNDKSVADLDKIDQNINQLKDDVDDLFQSNFNNIIVTFEDIDKCRSVLCQLELIQTVSQFVAEVTVNVPTHVEKSLSNFATTTSNANKTAATLTADYVLSTFTIIEEISQCIRDKIEA